MTMLLYARFLVFLIASAPLILPAGNACAQGSAAPQSAVPSPFPASFEIVSIRPMKADDTTPTHITNSLRNGSLKATNVNLKALLEVAFDIPDIHMYGGPAWLTTDRFSLEGKSDPNVDEQIARLSSQEAKQLKRRMLADLLRDRFKLAVHTETRQLPVYALVIAKGGPKLGGDKAVGDPAQAGNEGIAIRAGNDSLKILSYELSWRLGRPVLDHTGLQDRDALVLRWQDDDGANTDSSGPSVFTAIQEQLGLRLEAKKGSVPVLVIDHAEKPILDQ